MLFSIFFHVGICFANNKLEYQSEEMMLFFFVMDTASNNNIYFGCATAVLMLGCRA